MFPMIKYSTYKITQPYVDNIMNTLTEEDRTLMSFQADEKYLAKNGKEQVVYRSLLLQHNIPVSFFDLLDVGDALNAVVVTRSGKYRGHGNANKVVTEGLQWWDLNKHNLPYKKINWWVDMDNISSVNLAEEHGFIKDLTSTSEYDNFILYEKH